MKSYTESDLWCKIREHQELCIWTRIENLASPGAFDCEATGDNMHFKIELKVGTNFDKMPLRPSQVKYALMMQGYTDKLFVMRYNYKDRVIQLTKVWDSMGQPTTGHFYFELKMMTWEKCIRLIEECMFNATKSK